MVNTYNDLYLDIRQQFIRAGIASPEFEARELVCAAFGKTKEEFHATRHMAAADQGIRLCEKWVKSRLEGCPLAYILGSWDFFGLSFRITPDVLIPRADTEVLVSAVLLDYPEVSALKILDLCSGSGCIGIALLKNLPGSFCCFTDISQGALTLASENAAAHGLKGRYACFPADVSLPPPEIIGTFDIIVCNPPYIPEKEIGTLDWSVRGYEPVLALNGGYDGLELIRKISNGWRSVMRPGGRIYMECGAGQAGAVTNILSGAGWKDAVRIRDLSGIERIVKARYGEPAGNGEANINSALIK